MAYLVKTTKSLPSAGGLEDQPSRLMDAIRFTWSEQYPHEAKRLGPIAALLM